MDKKGSWVWDNLGMILITLLILITVIIFIVALKGKGADILAKFKELI